MKNLLLILSLCLASATIAQTREVKPNLSPLTRKYLQELSKSPTHDKALDGYASRMHADGNVYLSALIKVDNAELAELNLKSIDANIGTKAGNIWTVQVLPVKINEFTNLAGISYIELDQAVFPELNIARGTTRVDSVQRGINLPMPYSGKDVVMGIIDFGFDYNHPAFFDTLYQQYRIRKVWELNGVGSPPAGFTYGNELADSITIKIQGTDDPEQMHGTSVAGIATGSGYGSSTTNNRLRGMAFGSDVVLVGVRRDTIASQWQQGTFTDFIDGVNYIFNYASQVSKPCVVNISWGSQSGPHDGSTLQNQAFNNLTGPGKIIVMSAGNEGTEKIHLTKTFTPTDTVINTFLKFTNQNYQRTWVDAWGDSAKSFCIAVTLYSANAAGNTTSYICVDDSIHDHLLINANGSDTCFVQFINSTAEFNGRPRMIVDIYNKGTDSVGVSFKANEGTIHSWNEYYFYGFKYGYQCSFDSLAQSWARNGNSTSTVSDMGAADSVILVGAYASKVTFTDINSNSWTYSSYVLPNRLVPFSSRGPYLDGRIKPDITAPGLTLATSVSSYDTSYTPIGSASAYVITSFFDAINNHTYYYAEFSGTSASSPATAGIVALLLQADPTLSPSRVRDLFNTTAIKDAFTGVIPPSGNNNWGHGKVNAYGAMKQLLLLLGTYSYAGEPIDVVLFPNPGSGSFSIDYNSNKKNDLNIEVYNMIGGKVMQENWPVINGINRHQLDLSHQSKGTYLVKISSGNGFASIKAIVN